MKYIVEDWHGNKITEFNSEESKQKWFEENTEQRELGIYMKDGRRITLYEAHQILL